MFMKETGDTNRWKDLSLDGKDEYCQNHCTTQGNLQIQCNSYQITKGIFHKIEQKFFKFVWKHKRPQIYKAILRKKTELEESEALPSD